MDIRVFLGCIFVFMLLLFPKDASAWVSGWTYRKSHVITGSIAGAQTNYQVRVTVHRTAGSDSGDDVYVGAACKADFGDINFTSSDGSTPLSYWLESVNGNIATFWVKIPSIPASPGTGAMFIYYGNPSVSTSSNGQDTFLMFDDFSGASLNPRWNDNAGSHPVANGYVRVVGTTGVIRDSGDSWLYNVMVRSRFRTSSIAGVGRVGLSNSSSASGYNAGDSVYQDFYSDNTMYGVSYKNANDTYAGFGGYSINTWYTMNFKWDSGNFIGSINDGAESTFSTNIANRACSPKIQAQSAVFNLDVDWMFVSKWATPEPSHGTWGSEETEPSAPQITALSISASLEQVNLNWFVDFPGSDIINVECSLNDNQNCVPFPYQSVPGGGGCYIDAPNYDLTEDPSTQGRTVQNFIRCKAYSQSTPDVYSEQIRYFYPIAFEVQMPDNLGMVVGEKQELALTVRNYGMLNDSYSLNVSSSDPRLRIEAGIQHTRLLKTDEVQRVVSGTTMMMSGATLFSDITVNSTVLEKIHFNQRLTVRGSEKSLPDIDAFGIVQIIMISGIVVNFIIYAKKS
jgi:hypothetical protein